MLEQYGVLYDYIVYVECKYITFVVNILIYIRLFKTEYVLS